MNRICTIVTAIIAGMLLSGCGVLNMPPVYAEKIWHEKDLDNFVTKHYPAGSHEDALMRDFTNHGYQYTVSRCQTAPNCQKSLSTRTYCSYVSGVRHGKAITWHANEEGIIERISTVTLLCLLAP